MAGSSSSSDSGQRPVRSRSLSRSIFAAVLSFTLVAVLATAIALVTVSYLAEEKRSEEALVMQARACAEVLESCSVEERVELIRSQFPGPERFTLVDPAGVVVYDTEAADAALDNHHSRPEMLQAGSQGESVLVRHSDTLGQDTLYVAEQLEDGSFIRISEERLSLFAFLGSMAVPVGILMVGAVLLVILLSRFLTARIMRPLHGLDANDPLAGDVYEEMQPILQRIDQQQRQLKRQNEELKQAEGLRREFSANVSHEMKTPLQVISGSAEMIAGGLVAPEDVRDFGGRIYQESQRLRALINDVLTLSRLDEASFDAAERTPVNLSELVRRTCERLEPLACERQVSLTFDGMSVSAEGSEPLVEQAVSNLVENAIRYTGEGGIVTVRVESQAADAVAPDRVAGEGDAALGGGPFAGPWAVVRVQDTGIGIPAEDLSKIFERFYRTEKSRSKETGGTGLGLAIVKHVASYHNGDVVVESALGEGSTFTLRLPLMSGEGADVTFSFAQKRLSE